MSRVTKGRLTVKIKNSIIEQVKKETLDASKEKRDKKMGVLALAIRVDFLGDDLELIEGLSDRILGTNAYFYVNFQLEEQDQYSSARMKLPEYMKMWNISSGGYPLYKRKHKFTKSFRAIEAEFEDAKEEWSNLKDNLQAVLGGVTSIQALLKQWPEVTKYLPKEEKKVETLPAIPADKLNCLISHAKGEVVDCEQVAA